MVEVAKEFIPEQPVQGLGNLIAQGASEPMWKFVYQPGAFRFPNRRRDKKSGKTAMGKRVFVPNPHFPDGIVFSFPAWFVATVGIIALAQATGYLAKVLGGERTTKKEKSVASELISAWAEWFTLGAVK